MRSFRIVYLFLLILTTSVVYAQENTPAPLNSQNENWSSNVNFDYAGNTIGKQVIFFDDFGISNQIQARNYNDNSIWISEKISDSKNRLLYQTFLAKSNLSQFSPVSNFVQFSNPNFQTVPSPVTSSSSLGSYYSNSNSADPYQDVTSYPYSRQEYSSLTPNMVLRSEGGNMVDIDNLGTQGWVQSYSFTMISGQELNDVKAFGNNINRNRKMLKKIDRDVHGVETISFVDTDGKLLGTARSGNEDGNQGTQSVSLTMQENGYIDFHIPKGITGFVLQNSGNNYSGGIYKLFNLITEQIVVGAYGNLTEGCYRLAVENPDDFDPSLGDVKIIHSTNYYDFSLNYLDLVGNTIISEQPLKSLQSGSYSRLQSSFEYNSIGQLIKSVSPDEGEVRFVYRDDGQIRFSKNSEQKIQGSFSYTNYDSFGRPQESGVYKGTDHNSVGSWFSLNSTDLYSNDFVSSIINAQDGLNDNQSYERIITKYDQEDGQLQSFLNSNGIPVNNYKQTFLSGNVSFTTTVNPFRSSTWYSYDVLGRLRFIVQKIDGINYPITIDYSYDPENGSLVKIDYQKNKSIERFIHRYTYDTTGALVLVETSINDLEYKEQASYDYNIKGQLIRNLIGEDIQGIDYVYNLQGQLKSINHPSLNPANDPGGDGTNGVAADVFGFSLDYYNGDYKRSNTPKPIVTNSQNIGQDQFNGNIKSVRWNNFQQNTTNHDAYAYQYDKNNWLKQATFGNSSLSQGNHTASFVPNSNNDFQVSNLDYDANGNILSLKRNGFTDSQGSNSMDDFTYKYQNGTNQLEGITDTGDNTDVNRYNDLKDQNVQTTSNYHYNSIGQLVSDAQEGVTYEYNSSGLLKKMYRFDQNTSAASDYKTLFYEDFSSATDSDALTWNDNSVGANTASIQYGGTTFISIFGGGCEYLKDTYESTLNLRYQEEAPNIMMSNYRVISGVPHQLDMDIIADQYIKLNRNGVIGEYHIDIDFQIRVLQGNIILASQFYNTTEPANDPDLIGQTGITNSGCNQYFDQHASLTFTPGQDIITVEIKMVVPTTVDQSNRASLYIDNIHLQALATPVMEIAYNDKNKRMHTISYGTNSVDHTYYVRDASGLTMGIYTKSVSSNNNIYPYLSEQNINGIGRIGVRKLDRSSIVRQGDYLYQIADHLGNVRAVVTKDPVSGQVVAISKTDYYPLGMPMPSRNLEGGYRYGYQGEFAEKDSQTGFNAFELRLWDSRIGRWMNPDPAKQFNSPYLGMGNNWINGMDPDGAFFIADDFLYGFIGGLFQNRDNFSDTDSSRFGNAINNGSRMANNSLNIWASLGRTDPNKTFGGKVLQVASKLTWELPQSLLGVFSGHLIGYANGIEDITNFHGATVIRTKSLKEYGDTTDNYYWGFTLGSVITTSYTKSETLKRHEFGHYLVSRFQGPLFLPANILSPVTAAVGYDFHIKMPWERWADRKSDRFFKNQDSNN